MKVYKSKSLVLSFLAMTFMSCQNTDLGSTNKLVNNEIGILNLSNDKLRDPDESIKCEKESGFNTKAEDENLKLVDTVKPGQVFLDKEESPGFYVGKKVDRSHSVSHPLYDSEIKKLSVIFEDKFKIRVKIDKESDINSKNKEDIDSDSIIDEFELERNKKEVRKSFESKLGMSKDSTEEFNKLMKSYNVSAILSSDESEESADKTEESIEKTEHYDFPNGLSMHTLQFKESKGMKEFGEKLRKLDIVREVNNVSVTSSTYYESSNVPANEPIFTGNVGSTGIQDASRYMYSRINADLFWGLIEQYNTNNPSSPLKPAKVAVIDRGFATNHEDHANYVDKFVCDGTNSLCTVSTNDYEMNKDETNLPLNDPITSDETQHGGQVSGIIGSPINNKGLVGLASHTLPYQNSAEIVAIVAVANSDGIIYGINKVIEYNRLEMLKTNVADRKPIRVINISRATPTKVCVLNSNCKDSNLLYTYEEPLEHTSGITARIAAARDVGILTVITAGNSSHKIEAESYTRSSALVIGGTAKSTNGRAAIANRSGSNWGRRVDISAPYESIPSITANYLNPTQYSFADGGTSLSAPMVTALASVLFNSRSDLKEMTATSVDKVKNLIVFSGKPINTDKPLGPIREITENHEYRTPNGLLLDMHKALDLALKMQPNKSYVRIFNSDFKTRVFRNRGTQPIIFSSDPYILESTYKDDKIMEIPNSTQDLNFRTYNKSCVYSWGYQIWKSDGSVPYNNVRGIAGKKIPVGSNQNVGIQPQYNKVLTYQDTGINATSKEYPDVVTWGYW